MERHPKEKVQVRVREDGSLLTVLENGSFG
jgi:hypothetical protein